MSESGNTPVQPIDQTESTPVPSGTGTPPVNNGGEPETLTLTTAQLAKRLDVEVNKALSRMFETLGVKDATEAQSRLKVQKETEDAGKSELEKAHQKIADLEKKAAEAETAAAKAQQERMEERRNAAILTALTGADKPQSVLNLLLVEHPADVAALMTDDGTIDAKKVTTLTDKAKKEYAGMFKSGSPGSPSNSGGKTPTPDSKNLLDQIKARI